MKSHPPLNDVPRVVTFEPEEGNRENEEEEEKEEEVTNVAWTHDVRIARACARECTEPWLFSIQWRAHDTTD